MSWMITAQRSTPGGLFSLLFTRTDAPTSATTFDLEWAKPENDRATLGIYLYSHPPQHFLTKSGLVAEPKPSVRHSEHLPEPR